MSEEKREVPEAESPIVNQRKVALWIVFFWVVLTVSLSNAAAAHNQWRGFWVSEIQLIGSMIALVFLLAPRGQKGKDVRL